MKKIGYILAIAAAFTYGFSGVLLKTVLDTGADTHTVLLFRVIIPIPFLVLVAKLRNQNLLIGRVTSPTMGLLGLLLILPWYFSIEATSRLPVGTSTIIIYSFPLISIIALRLIFGVKISKPTFFISVGGFVGIYLLVGEHNNSLSSLGICLALLGAASLSFYVIFLNQFAKKLDSLIVTIHTLVFATIAVFSFTILTKSIVINFDSKTWLSLLGSSLLSAVGMVCFLPMTRALGVSKAIVASNLQPTVTILLARIILAETLSTVQIFAVIVILSSVFSLQFVQDQ